VLAFVFCFIPNVIKADKYGYSFVGAHCTHNQRQGGEEPPCILATNTRLVVA
jgi:hypothetical protein